MMAIVDTYKSLPNLLIWETVHEPDGNSDPFNAAQNTYDVIYQMDGYHPVSTVLDCENYILLFAVRHGCRYHTFTTRCGSGGHNRQAYRPFFQDAYPLCINATFRRCGTRRVRETLVTADAMTARAA